MRRFSLYWDSEEDAGWFRLDAADDSFELARGRRYSGSPASQGRRCVMQESVYNLVLLAHKDEPYKDGVLTPRLWNDRS